jgi:penicillin V acylase-like amidase (Ntn superfamily)
MVCGRNFDYSHFDYLIFVSKRNVSKRALQYDIENDGNPLTWTSKYGSITFNLCGSEFATDGINETGLIVTALMLDDTEYQLNVSAPSVLVDQWVQYLLDNCGSVEEVIQACSSIHIRYNPWDYWRLHIFVTDKSGNNAAIEFLNNQIVVSTGDNLVKTVLTNSPYTYSLNYYNNGVYTGSLTSSLNRFARAAKLLDNYDDENLIDYSYSILDSIAQIHTNRKIVYDLSNMRVYLKSINNTNIRYFDLNTFNFSCNEPILLYDEKNEDSGNIQDKFVVYSKEWNKLAIEAAWIFLNKTYTTIELEEFSNYPLSFVCTDLTRASILNSLSNELNVKLYPNPVDKILYIQIDLSNEKFYNFKIVDEAGSTILEKYDQRLNPASIDTDFLSKGEYFIIITDTRRRWSKKFVKI